MSAKISEVGKYSQKNSNSMWGQFFFPQFVPSGPDVIIEYIDIEISVNSQQSKYLFWNIKH